MPIPTSPDFNPGETSPVRFTCDATMSRRLFAARRTSSAEGRRRDGTSGVQVFATLNNEMTEV